MRRLVLAVVLGGCGIEVVGASPAPDAGAPIDASTPPSAEAGDDSAVGFDAGNCTADIANDAHNCGACGHDCLGTACAAGRCATTTMASAQNGPLHVAVDATDVYWTNDMAGTIAGCAKGGCVTPSVLASGQGAADRIVAASGGLFWTNYGTTIGACALPGCAGGPKIVASSQASTVGIAADATNVYFTTGDGYVKSCARDGCGATPTNLATAQQAPTGMGISDTWLAWTNITDGSVLGCQLPACSTKVTYVTGHLSPAFVAVDATRVYWTTQGIDPDRKGAVWSCPRAGCAGGPAPRSKEETYPTVISLHPAKHKN
jgi:hypothetical protein